MQEWKLIVAVGYIELPTGPRSHVTAWASG